jgi:hypothetical protein
LLIIAGLLLASIAAVDSYAASVTISGTVKYTDLGGGTFPVRSAEIELWDSNIFFDQMLSFGSLGNTGFYSFTIDDADTEALAGTIDPYILVRTEFGTATAGFNVFLDGPTDTSYTEQTAPTDNIAGNTTIDFTIGNGTNSGRAFASFDALVQSNFYAGFVRPGLPSVSHGVKLDYPASQGAESAFYQPATNQINIGQNLAHAWDVINHEYGHFLSDIDNLDDSPGGAHCFGLSNITGGMCGTTVIPALGKNAGTRLAWGEGLADYISSATHDVGGFNMPAIPTVNDAQYTHRSSVGANQFTVPIEGNGVNDGEGDEAPIMRILWDIADTNNGGHDAIGIGHDSLYQVLDDIPNLDRLDDVWDHFFANTGDLELGALPVDQKRAMLGDIFEEYDISPDPTGAIIDALVDLTGGAPTFSWARNNENANDDFDIIIFNDDFTGRLLEVAVPGNVTSYTLTAGEWDMLKDARRGLRNFVIVGSDTTTFTTGPYWSGAEMFTLIPEPSTLFLGSLAAAMVALARRRT